MQNNRLALFDFCDTLVRAQTANLFIEEYIHWQQHSVIKKLRLWAFRWLRKLRQLDGQSYKLKIIGLLAGERVNDLEKFVPVFVEQTLFPIENRSIVEKLAEHKRLDETVVIISGGFSSYLEPYGKMRNVDLVMATELEKEGGYYTGRIAGIDCLGEEKVRRLKSQFPENEWDFQNSTFYSDSPSDIPLFRLIGNAVVVERQDRKLQWPDDFVTHKIVV